MKNPNRLSVLRDIELTDLLPAAGFDDAALLAARVCRTDAGAVAILNGDTEIMAGTADLPPRSILTADDGFTAKLIGRRNIHADADIEIRLGETVVRAFAAAAIIVDETVIGSVVAASTRPRTFTGDEIATLTALAKQVSANLELRRTAIKLQRANAELENLSLTDELTGLYNNRGLRLHGERQLRTFRSRESDKSLWLMVGDIDGLKDINDRFGHFEGNNAIRDAGKLLSGHVRDGDIIARVGGDEFVMMMLTDKDASAETLRDRLETIFDGYNAASEDRAYRLEMSIGMLKVPFDSPANLAQLVKAADKQMYIQKRSRKKRRPHHGGTAIFHNSLF